MWYINDMQLAVATSDILVLNICCFQLCTGILEMTVLYTNFHAIMHNTNCYFVYWHIYSGIVK